jgi:hypothetical protein
MTEGDRLVDVLPGLKAEASTPPDGSAVAPAGPRPFLPALNGGVPRAFLMDWKTLLACITGSVEEQLLLRNEYVVEENRILRRSYWTSGGIRAKTCGFAQQENLRVNQQPDVDF